MEQMNYVITEEEMIYRTPEEIDHHVAKNLSKELDMLIEAYHVKTLVFDFQDTSFMDSSGIGVLIGRARKLYFFDGKVVARNLGPRVEKIFNGAGLKKMIEVEKNVNE
ncbi:MAG: anti-sigma factor antagonist [Agathobacter sp.]|nr:anti-sigma factor antagonist [Agathobacter sp.]